MKTVGFGRLARTVVVVAALGGLTGCAVYARPAPALAYRGPVCVTGHYNAWGYWVPGHCR